VCLCRTLLKERQSPLAILMLVRVLAVHTPLRKFVPDSTKESFLGEKMFTFSICSQLWLASLHPSRPIGFKNILNQNNWKIQWKIWAHFIFSAQIKESFDKFANNAQSLQKRCFFNLCRHLNCAQNVHLMFHVRALFNCDLVRDGWFLPAKTR